MLCELQYICKRVHCDGVICLLGKSIYGIHSYFKSLMFCNIFVMYVGPVVQWSFCLWTARFGGAAAPVFVMAAARVSLLLAIFS